MGSMMLIFGISLWFVVATTARNEAVKTKAKEDYLEVQIRRAAAYFNAFASAIDPDIRERATAEARLSAEFQDAREEEELASRVYYITAKAAKGDVE